MALPRLRAQGEEDGTVSDWDAANKKEEDLQARADAMLRAEQRAQKIHQLEQQWAAQAMWAEGTQASTGRVNGQHYVGMDAVLASLVHHSTTAVAHLKQVMLIAQAHPSMGTTALVLLNQAYLSVNVGVQEAPAIIAPPSSRRGH